MQLQEDVVFAVVRKRCPFLQSFEDRVLPLLDVASLGQRVLETAMGRVKQLVGGNLRSRKLSTQQGEIAAKCHALNIMTSLGMPEGEWITQKAA